MAIKKAAVIGAGVMGANIAAHLTNAGIEVELLDIVPKDATDRDIIAKSAIGKMAKDKLLPLMHRKNTKKMRAGNTEDHMDRIKDCDLIIEAVLENPKIKSIVFKNIDKHRKAGAIVASNTSTIPLKDLIADQSESFKKDFFVTHFFNPPRHMRLLELITSEHNSKEKIAEVTKFMDEKMGKGVVICNDTPGFIGNRIGTFWIQAAINEAYDRGLTVEEADALMGRPIGVPKTGVFALVDMVGLDLMPHISESLLSKLPKNDGYCKINKSYPVIEKMIADGYTGRKGKGGFYRRNAKKENFAVDLNTGAERPKVKPKGMKALKNSKKKGLRGLVSTSDKYGDYAWSVLKQTLSYAAEHVHEITSDITGVDEAMKLGYGWKYGPFELLDKIGVDYFIKRMEAEGETIPQFIQAAKGKSFYRTHGGKLQFLSKDGSYADVKRPEGVLLLSDIKRASKPVAKNMSANIWDIGDGVLCLEFTSKMNSLDFMSLRMIHKACNLVEKSGGKYKALVIHNEADDFSVGANIGVALVAAKLKIYWVVDKMVQMGQKALKRLKYANFPVVSAPSGKALGGGCEVLLHSSAVQAHCETYPGLVEVGVGLLPAWGGSTELLTRGQKAQDAGKMAKGPIPPLAKAFESISAAKVGTSAFEAKDLMILRDTDGVTMNKYRLLADAKAKALKMVKDYKPEEPYKLKLAGASGLAALNMAVDGFYLKGLATPYDVVVSEKVAKVLTGGYSVDTDQEFTQDEVRAMERKQFMSLVRDARTVARIETILKTGRPLREKPIAGKKAADLRLEADKKGFFAKIFNSSSNDNKKHQTEVKKPKVNWPKLG